METALAAAWPVPWTEDYGEFELRASTENSNRGNCVRLVAERPDVATLIEVARPFFERHGRPLQIAVSEPLAFADRELAAIGLGAVNPSLIMKRPAPCGADSPIPERLRVEGHTSPTSTWLAAWSECAGLGATQDAHFSIVKKMRDRAYFVSLHDGSGAPLAVGSFVCHGPWRCFGNLATRKDARQQGFGSLVLEVLTAREVSGVDYDILQVDRHNPAVNLYRKHEFRSAYPYHYRREMSSSGEAPQGA